tara:strand:+ start:3307 stop:4284 length:978 start_codon:yes stop_codon:yes gene_type:complete
MIQQDKSCQICHSNIFFDTSYLDTYGHTLFQDKQMIVCQGCGFGQIYPKIEKHDLNEFYENYWRSSKSPAVLNFKEWALSKNVLDSRSISQLLLGTQYLVNKESYSFMDIGPGIGWSFISAKKILDNVRLFTIELCREATAYYAKNLDNITIFNSLGDVKEDMDVVLMSHSLEHFDIDDIDDLFFNIHGLLAENGVFVIEVPNEMPMKHINNHTPHLCFFTLESLKKLFNKFEDKFELCFVDTVGMLIADALNMSERKLESAKLDKSNSFVWLRTFVKKNIVKLGLYGFFRLFKQIKNIDKFFNTSDFKYGGERVAIRCILKKRS